MSKKSARVCAVITEETIDAARAAIKQAASVADLIEVRLDHLTDFDFTDLDVMRALVEDRSLPAIITCRVVSEGGRQKVDDEVRLRLLAAASQVASYCDVEAAHYEQLLRFNPDVSRLIVSYHDFSGTPADLDAIYDRITSLPAAVHKIVTRAGNVADSLAIFKLLERAHAEGRNLIGLAMGEAGLITRVLGPAFGSFLTYGSLGIGMESAPGQPSCDALVNLYRVHGISKATSITGIIGSPVAHSASPAMHNRAFAELDLDFVYLPFDVEDLAMFFGQFVRKASREINWNLAGLSVTIPHKRDVVPHLDQLNETARRAGSVNTVAVSDNRLIGYNTDVRGAMEPLERVLPLAGETCAVIGAGGAARAVIYGLLDRGARVQVFARNPEKASELADSFGVNVLPIESLGSNDARIIINTTPIGMRGHSEGSSPVPESALADRTIAYDLIYNPLETRFLIDALAAGCQAISGIEMLVAQAAIQFQLWTGERPSIDSMRSAAIEKIAERHSAGDKSNKQL
jgi:3-dehydroquinate dehydratase / shikimate dehydrogenase